MLLGHVLASDREIYPTGYTKYVKWMRNAWGAASLSPLRNILRPSIVSLVSLDPVAMECSDLSVILFVQWPKDCPSGKYEGDLTAYKGPAFQSIGCFTPTAYEY